MLLIVRVSHRRGLLELSNRSSALYYSLHILSLSSRKHIDFIATLNELGSTKMSPFIKSICMDTYINAIPKLKHQLQ